MAKEYLEFDLRIWKSPEGYGASASSPGRGGIGPVILAPPFRDGELEALPVQSGVIRRDLEATGSHAPQRMQDLGRRLFEAVFRAEIQTFWTMCREAARQSGKALRLRLTLLSPELWSWPWELLADPADDFLIASPDFSLVRYPEIPQPIPSLRVAPPIKVLVAMSDPKGCQRLDFEQELRALGSLLRVGESNRWELELLEHASLSGLKRKLAQGFHILHFIGHGAFDRSQEEGALLFEKGGGELDPVSGRDLARILRRQSRLTLVVLNTCEGGRAPRGDPFAGVAQSLIRGGIPAVVAMQFKVADEASIIFSRALYEILAKASSLDEAVSEGRHALLAERLGCEWANPVLYMRSSDGRIFDIKPPWAQWLAITALLLMVLTVELAVWNDIQYSLFPGPTAIASDPGCPSPPGLEMSFAKISPGRFSMGSARGPEAERPAHEVEITHAYCIGRFEVTQWQWKQVMGENPSRHHHDFRPVEGVSWSDVQQFLSRLNQGDPVSRYRLPTEAEWEFAAVTGGGSPEPEEVSQYGNCLGWHDIFHKTARIGSFKPNSGGVFDLYGNVSEWVSDWYGPYPTGQVIDPLGPLMGTEKVRRGGFFGNSAENCTASYRARSKPGRRTEDTGFRVVRDVEGKSPSNI